VTLSLFVLGLVCLLMGLCWKGRPMWMSPSLLASLGRFRKLQESRWLGGSHSDFQGRSLGCITEGFGKRC
jgi:hypothetical protein